MSIMLNFDEWISNEPCFKESNEFAGDMEPYDQYSDDKLTGDDLHAY